MNMSIKIILLGLLVLLINIPTFKRQKPSTQYKALTGDFKGQTHTIKDWRLISLELARTVKNSTLCTKLKYTNTEDLIGLLYLNFGIDLVEV